MLRLTLGAILALQPAIALVAQLPASPVLVPIQPPTPGARVEPILAAPGARVAPILPPEGSRVAPILAPTDTHARTTAAATSFRQVLSARPPTATSAQAIIPAGVVLVSAGLNGASANSTSDFPALSADGRYVVYSSLASNLVAGDTNGATDIFVYDHTTGQTTRESVGPGGVQANGSSVYPAISADGRYVAFESVATNLVPGVTGQQTYVRDRQQGLTIVASVNTRGLPGNGPTFDPSISGDGRFVSFGSTATNLAPLADDTNGCADIFTHDLSPGPTTRDNISTAGVQAGCGGVEANSASQTPSLSGDGRYVAFQSYGTNLVPGDTERSSVFVRDRLTSTTTLESFATAAGLLNASPSISADGRYLAFRSIDPVALVDSIYLRDRSMGQTTSLVATNSAEGPRISADGRFVSFTRDFFTLTVYDRIAGKFTTITDDALEPTAVGGGVVAFVSLAPLVVNDTNGDFDVYLAPVVGAGTPGAPTGLKYSLTGSTLTLTWTAPVNGGAPAAYTIEAGSSPGAIDIAHFSTGSTSTTFSATVGGNAVFYIRVRATNTEGVSAPSNEVPVVVGTASAPPGPPGGLSASVTGSAVTLTWRPPATGAATSFIVEAGSATGLANLANFNTNSVATTFTAVGVASGTYFVRIRGAGAGGLGPPSNEVVVTVLSAPPRVRSG